MRIIAPGSLLPDTNILVHHVRRSRLDQWIKANYALAPNDPPSLLSIVIVGDNDLWIAATAQITGTTLLTTDKDYDHLSPFYIQRDWIDPALP